MSETTVKKGNSDLFLEYLNQYKEEVRSTTGNEFYHVDVVAEAYNQGFNDGSESARDEFVEQLIQKRVEEFKKKAQQVYILSSRLISFLREKGFNVEALYISPTFIAPKALIVVNEELILNDDFVFAVYPKIHEFREIFCQLFSDVLDMGIVGSEDLDTQLLKEDGFGYEEIYKKQ